MVHFRGDSDGRGDDHGGRYSDGTGERDDMLVSMVGERDGGDGGVASENVTECNIQMSLSLALWAE